NNMRSIRGPIWCCSAPTAPADTSARPTDRSRSGCSRPWSSRCGSCRTCRSHDRPRRTSTAAVSAVSRSPRGSGRSRAATVAAALEQLYPRLVEFAAQTNALPPGAEWMLENHFVIRRAAREVRTGLGAAFERRLPRGADRGRRVEQQARAMLTEVDWLLDRPALVRRVERFGVEHEATLAELWALPLYLRLLVLEQLAADGPTLVADRPLDVGTDQRI